MNSLDFNSYGLEEMNEVEMMETEGGLLWIPIAIAMMLIANSAY